MTPPYSKADQVRDAMYAVADDITRRGGPQWVADDLATAARDMSDADALKLRSLLR